MTATIAAAARPVRLGGRVRLAAGAAMTAPALALFAVLFLLPMGTAVELAAVSNGAPTFDRFAQSLSGAYLADLWFTLATAAAAALLCVGAGLAVAALLHALPIRLRRLGEMLVLVPLIVPHIVAAYAIWLTLLPGGPLSAALAHVGLPGALSGFSGGAFALVIALSWKFLPVATLTIAAALEGLDRSLVEAAQDAGAGPWRRFAAITAPQLYPAMISGGALVFIMAAAQFSITLVVYAGKSPTTIPMGIYYEAFGLGRWDLASALGLVLTVATLGVLAITIRLTRRRAHDDC
ncbi:ABC transporter permease [Rubrimonas sp.]|uniref:ABC transporter permease n=1 Tax=Rubrimonas sp. TaxID=2036015 RepID=UPI002FDE5309